MTNITDQLPYELCDGVVAHNDCLWINDSHLVHHFFPWLNANIIGDIYVPWPDVAELLRYEPGKLSCACSYVPSLSHYEVIECYHETWEFCNLDEPLDRIAAVFCRNATAFRVLYQCIKEFGHARD